MAKVTFVTKNGAEVVVEDATGTLMEVATSHDVEGILGSCGGVCSCVTCHVHVRLLVRSLLRKLSEHVSSVEILEVERKVEREKD